MSGKLVVKDSFCAAALVTADYPGFGGITPLSGFLKKKSRGGSWQKRWFETRNHFLNYYKNNRHTGSPLAVVDLRQADDVRIVQRFGQFDIISGDTTFSLKAESLTQAKQWKTALEERMSVDAAVSDKDPIAGKPPAPAQKAGGAPTAGAADAATAPAAATGAATPEATDSHAKRLRTCGYLMKKGGQRHNWRRRFFVLTKSELEYKADASDPQPKGCIGLKDASVVVSPPGNKHQHYFEVLAYIPEGARVFPLRAEDSTEFGEWVAALERVGVRRLDPDAPEVAAFKEEAATKDVAKARPSRSLRGKDTPSGSSAGEGGDGLPPPSSPALRAKSGARALIPSISLTPNRGRGGRPFSARAALSGTAAAGASPVPDTEGAPSAASTCEAASEAAPGAGPGAAATAADSKAGARGDGAPAVAAVEDWGPSRSGLLKKRSLFQRSVKRLGSRQWTELYCEVRGGVLRFFRREGDREGKGAIHLHTVDFIRPALADGRGGRQDAFEVSVGGSTGQLFQFRARDAADCAAWIDTLQRASQFALRLALGADAAAVEATGGSTRVVTMELSPWMRRFDASSSEEREMKALKQAAAYFERSDGTLTAVLTAAQELVDDLSDLAAECISVPPALQGPRLDILELYTHRYHQNLVLEVTPFTSRGVPGSKLAELSQDQLVLLLRWMHDYLEVLERRVAPHVNLDEHALSFKSDLQTVTQLYLSLVSEAMETWCRRISHRMSDTEQRSQATFYRRMDGGRPGTFAPVDLFNMISTNVDAARSGNVPELLAGILDASLASLVKYEKDIVVEMRRAACLPQEVLPDPDVEAAKQAAALARSASGASHAQSKQRRALTAMSKVGNLFGRSSRARGVGGGSPPGSASSLRSGGSGGSREATPPSAFSVESVNGSPLEGQDLGQPDLYYIFAAVNDCYEMMEKVQALEEEHSALAEQHRVDFEMVQKVLSQGGMKGCTYLIEILMGDLYPLLDQLFPGTGHKGDQEVMSTVVVTLTDYGSDFRQFLKPYFFQKLVGELASRVVCEYLDTLCTASARESSFQLTPSDVASMHANVQSLDMAFGELLEGDDGDPLPDRFVMPRLDVLRDMEQFLSRDPAMIPSLLRDCTQRHPTSVPLLQALRVAAPLFLQLRQDVDDEEMVEALQASNRVLDKQHEVAEQELRRKEAERERRRLARAARAAAKGGTDSGEATPLAVGREPSAVSEAATPASPDQGEETLSAASFFGQPVKQGGAAAEQPGAGGPARVERSRRRRGSAILAAISTHAPEVKGVPWERLARGPKAGGGEKEAEAGPVVHATPINEVSSLKTASMHPYVAIYVQVFLRPDGDSIATRRSRRRVTAPPGSGNAPPARGSPVNRPTPRLRDVVKGVAFPMSASRAEPTAQRGGGARPSTLSRWKIAAASSAGLAFRGKAGSAGRGVSSGAAGDHPPASTAGEAEDGKTEKGEEVTTLGLDSFLSGSS